MDRRGCRRAPVSAFSDVRLLSARGRRANGLRTCNNSTGCSLSRTAIASVQCRQDQVASVLDRATISSSSRREPPDEADRHFRAGACGVRLRTVQRRREFDGKPATCADGGTFERRRKSRARTFHARVRDRSACRSYSLPEEDRAFGRLPQPKRATPDRRLNAAPGRGVPDGSLHRASRQELERGGKRFGVFDLSHDLAERTLRYRPP